MRRNIKNIIKWTVYWIAFLGTYTAASVIFGNYIMYLPVLILAAVNFLLRIALEFPISRLNDSKVKKVLSLGATLVSVMAVICLCGAAIETGTNYNEAYINNLDYSVFGHQSHFFYDNESGVYTVRAESNELKILQFTDIHLGGGITTIDTDRKAIDACYTLIKETQPDLIIVTGDIVYPIPAQAFNKNSLKPFYQFCSFMNNVGTPWAMVYGNHDTEVVTGYDSRSFESLCRDFKENDTSPMLYADKQPGIYGRYNQYLRIENQDGSINRLIFLVDSNDYIKATDMVKEYDSVHQDQIDWYAETIDDVSRQENHTVKSFVFMHIPFQEFAEAEKALEAGSPEAVHLFGENNEDVNCPDYNSGFFDAILSKKSTEAVFVGHDHVNNMGVKYKGVDLVYSKSIDYLAYPRIAQMTRQRGATLITVMQDGRYTIRQIDYDE